VAEGRITTETLKKAKADYLGARAVETSDSQLRGVKIDVMVGVRDLVLFCKSFSRQEFPQCSNSELLCI
jgi:hypothetical protein